MEFGLCKRKSADNQLILNITKKKYVHPISCSWDRMFNLLQTVYLWRRFFFFQIWYNYLFASRPKQDVSSNYFFHVIFVPSSFCLRCSVIHCNKLERVARRQEVTPPITNFENVLIVKVLKVWSNLVQIKNHHAQKSIQWL